MSVLVTGGVGYIGSHMCVELLEEGYDVIALDNLSNSNPIALERIKDITGKEVKFEKVDIRDRVALSSIFENNNIDSVIHFAGFKAVGESVENPLRYYDNNVSGTITLCEVMNDFNVKKLVFSSSATVYGDPISVPIKENFSLSATNPYGRSKLIIEEMLQDIQKSDPNWSIALLRYFNPVGAHQSGLIGEDPDGIPNNLMPYISQVATGKLKKLSVFGGDYSTHDGTGVRDYIHVVDLAKGHVKALEYFKTNSPRVLTVNLGTGNGYSVLDLLSAFEKASGQKVPYQIVARRAGDIAKCYADPGFAALILNWKAQFDINQMCVDTWRWQSNNPSGYIRD
jgi:UDP-glucose 4-epimerase